MRYSLRIFLCLFALAASPSATGQVPEGSARIATFNTYLLSPAFQCANLVAPDCVSQTSGQTSRAAEELATTILANSASLDIILLNEVWEEEAKRILVARLRSTYPIVVADIDAPLIEVQQQAISSLPAELRLLLPVRFAGEDSGLMLFAKRDFRILPLPANTHRWGDDPGEILRAYDPAPSTAVAFTRFRSCALPDCLAAKGAALIRLQHGTRGPIYNIVFTHMQADEEEADNRAVRRNQFEQIREMIADTLVPIEPELSGGNILVLAGDLNVPSLGDDESEFAGLFGMAGSFFTDVLYEAWSRAGEPADRTPTNSTDRVRLDYILASPSPAPVGGDLPLRRRCVQHLTVPREFERLGSDHNMVLADIGPPFPYCSPAIARRVDGPTRDVPQVTTDGSDIDPRDDHVTISAPGARQWFLVDAREEGTFSIGLDNSALRVDLYAPDNLTEPISRYNATPGTMKPPVGEFYLDQYDLPPVFYVRVSGARRDLAGDYALRIRRHLCASREDACILSPGRTRAALLSSRNPPQNEGRQDAAWFRYDVFGTPASGLPQTVTLTADVLSPGRITAHLVDHVDSPGRPQPAPVPAGSTVVFAGPMDERANGYLVISQHQPDENRSLVRATLETPIRFFRLAELTCHDETNPETGSDDVYVHMSIAGILHRLPPSGAVEYDCDEQPKAFPWGTRFGAADLAIVGQLSLRLFEEDDGTADDVSAWQEIGEMPFEDRQEIVWIFEDGEYRLTFDVRERPNAPAPGFN